MEGSTTQPTTGAEMDAQPTAAPTHKINGKVWTETGRSFMTRADARKVIIVDLAGPRGGSAQVAYIEGQSTAHLLTFGRVGITSDRICDPI